MDQIKEAFQKVKEDIFYLKQNINSLKLEIIDLKEELKYSIDSLKEIAKNLENLVNSNQINSSTHISINPTHLSQRADNPAHNLPLNDLIIQNIPISSGNEGVPTDSQQTVNRHPTHKNEPIIIQKNPTEDTLELLESLDNIKKDIRLKFKRLTDQEILVFSTIYQLEEQCNVDYKLIAEKLKLSESSVRDYVSRLIKKGISVEKNKINNKTVLLNISKSLRKMASLSTILQLRDL